MNTSGRSRALRLLIAFGLGGLLGCWLGASLFGKPISGEGSGKLSDSVALMVFESVPVSPRAEFFRLEGDGRVVLIYATPRYGRVFNHRYEGEWMSGPDPAELRFVLTSGGIEEPSASPLARPDPKQAETARELPWQARLRFRSETELEWVSADERFLGSRWRLRSLWRGNR